MRNNMRRKLLTFMCGLVAMVVIFGWFINSVFLERFYIYSKGKVLLHSMSTINHLYGSDSADMELELEKMQVSQGMQIVIFNGNLEAIYVAWRDTVRLGFGRRGILGPDLPGFVTQREGSADKENMPVYEISRNYDERLNTEYLDLLGALDNGLYALIRMPVQTITDSVGIANQFLLITGVFSILVSAFISARLSTQIARPIKAVEGIAKSMSRLDFTNKISVESQDEIGSLASSINRLSDHLQEAIQELQEKNCQLEKDIEYISKLDGRRKEFLSSVSHELKTPIALIQGYAEALEERVVTSDEDKDYYYHVISDEADKMNALVKKLMNLNNLEMGQDDLYLENFDIVSLVQSVIRRGKSLPGAERLDFQMAGPAEAWVKADEFLIEEVMFNYLTNAIHYASGRNLVRVTVKRMRPERAGDAAQGGEAAQGGGAGMAEAAAGPGPGQALAQMPGLPGAAADAATAETASPAAGDAGAAGQAAEAAAQAGKAAEAVVATESAPVKAASPEQAGEAAKGGDAAQGALSAAELADSRVRIEVFNSGSFLTDEERERVWESFYKADKSRSREYGGSGLGLTVVRAAMERHGSSCGVDNIEDGVSFWFELPVSGD